MSVQPAGEAGERTASRVLASAPWIVVLLGVGLLVVLLLFTLLSFRSSERQAVPPPAPPLVLPTLPATVPPGTSQTPATPLTATPSRTAATPSASATSRAPTTAATDQPMVGGTGRVTARYSVEDSDRNSFEARLVVRNGADRAADWRVELLFTGNVKSIQASSTSGVSVSTNGSGWYVLRGSDPLGAGDSDSVYLRFSRNGTGDRPGQCTVNGADCVIA